MARGSVVLLPEDPDALGPPASAPTSRPAPAATSAWSSPTPPGAPGARARPTSRSAPPASTSPRCYAGRVDAHGNELAVTAPAVADELAGLAELAQGKLGGRPFAVVRGRADLVLPAGDDGPGAAALVRPEGADLFGYGAREAVLRAARGEPGDAAAVRRPRAASSELHRRARRGGAAGWTSRGHLARPYGSWPSPTAGAPTTPSADGDIGLRPLTP